jgi:uncharacterized NAD(P)/FAD-binding protein YdhS
MNKQSDIFIVGGGATGTLFALHASRIDKNKKLTITLADDKGSFGRGLTYTNHNRDYHLLNVRSKSLSAFRDVPDDFCQWLNEKDGLVDPDDFVPRHRFGAYLTERLQTAVDNSEERIQLLHETIAQAYFEAGAWTIISSAGNHYTAKHLILACGNLQPTLPAGLHLGAARHKAWEPNPWNFSTFDGLERRAPVVLIGSGLTMADLLTELHTRKHLGPVLSISSHGFLPLSHHPPQPVWPDFGHELLEAKSTQALLQIFRRELDKAEDNGQSWTAVTDSVRPYVQRLWLNADAQQRQQFMQHIRHLWGVARHRLPPKTAAVVYEWISSGQLRVVAGRVLNIEPAAGDMLQVNWTARGDSKIRTVVTPKLINCTGPSSRYDLYGSKLMRYLFRAGYICSDPMGLGVHTETDGRVINASRQPQNQLFALGPMIRGILWEITAIPEIREQCAQLAETLCNT